MSRQPLGPERRTGGADHEYLGMGRGIGKFPRPVAGARNDLPCRIDQHRTHRNLAAEGSSFCFGERYIHMAAERRHAPR